MHLFVCSAAFDLHIRRDTIHRERSDLPRRLLASLTSISADLNKLRGAKKEHEESVETSVRKAPPSKSNPKQNK